MDNDVLVEQILRAWWTNNRVNLFLIERISHEGMMCTLSTRGGRNVCRQFANVHNNRVRHMERRAKDLAEGLHKFATKDEPDKQTLVNHLTLSADRMAQYWAEAVDGSIKRCGFKEGVITYLGYFVSHESHHRGSILLTLKQCGHNLNPESRVAIWNWDGL